MRGPASRRNRQSDVYDFPEGFIDQPIPESSRNHSIPIRYISVTPFSQIDSLLLSPDLQYRIIQKGRVGAARRTLSAQLPFWKPEEIGTPDRIPAQDSPLLGYAHAQINYLSTPALTALPDAEEYGYSALFNDEEDFLLDPMDSILRLYPESHKRYIEDQEILFTKRRRLD